MQPAYPDEVLRRGIGGQVRVELVFRAPDKAPTLTLLPTPQGAPYPELEDAVREHVMQLRVPCMEPTQPPVTLRQDCVFAPDNSVPVRWTSSEPDNARLQAMLKCVKPPSAPAEYPEEARRMGAEGSLIAQIWFDAADRPPRVEVRGLADPCTMNCPFDVRIGFRQPYMSNAVAQLGEPPLARQELLNWLTTLNVPREAHSSVFGDIIAFTVPCIKIDLKPKEN